MSTPLIARSLQWIGINLAVLLTGLFCLELIFGSWLQDNQIRRLNLILDATYLRKVEHLYPNDGQKIVYRRDHYGLRGPYEDPGSIDVLTIGGSTTDQRFIDEGSTWQDIVAQSFRRSGRRIMIANAGVDGHSTRSHLKSIERWLPHIPKLNARYVLLYVGLNDAWTLDKKWNFDRLGPKGDGSIFQRIEENSALYFAWRALRGQYLADSVGEIAHSRVDYESLRWVDDVRVKNLPERFKKGRRKYEKRLRALLEKFGDLGMQPICVTQISRQFKIENGHRVGIGEMQLLSGLSITGLDFFNLLELVNRTTREVCGEMGAIVFDLAGDLEVEFDDADFYDFSHNTPSGAQKIGNYLFEKLHIVFEHDDSMESKED